MLNAQVKQILARSCCTGFLRTHLRSASAGRKQHGSVSRMSGASAPGLEMCHLRTGCAPGLLPPPASCSRTHPQGREQDAFLPTQLPGPAITSLCDPPGSCVPFWTPFLVPSGTDLDAGGERLGTSCMLTPCPGVLSHVWGTVHCLVDLVSELN